MRGWTSAMLNCKRSLTGFRTDRFSAISHPYPDRGAAWSIGDPLFTGIHLHSYYPDLQGLWRHTAFCLSWLWSNVFCFPSPNHCVLQHTEKRIASSLTLVAGSHLLSGMCDIWSRTQTLFLALSSWQKWCGSLSVSLHSTCLHPWSTYLASSDAARHFISL